MKKRSEFLDTILQFNPHYDIELIGRAYDVAEEMHRGQLRKSGEPYLIHPMAVAEILADLGMDEETMFKVMEGFGLGMGGTYGTCGAVTGAIAVLSMRNSSGNLETPDSKGGTYKIVREVTEEFIEKNDSLVCRELKGIDTGRLLRSCPGCIEDAAEILAEILTKQGA